eukprot:1363077-Alexandrium_andersonii.AAC.1
MCIRDRGRRRRLRRTGREGSGGPFFCRTPGKRTHWSGVAVRRAADRNCLGESGCMRWKCLQSALA